jgi:hypothetical protein
VRWLIPGLSVVGSTAVLAMVTLPTSQTSPAVLSQSTPAKIRAVPHIADYKIRARVDLKQQTITGTTRITWRNRTTKTADTLCLHLYLNAFRSQDTLFYKGSGGKSRGNNIQRPGEIKANTAIIDGQAIPIEETNDGTTATVKLVEPVLPGEELTAEIPFVDLMPGISARAGAIDNFMMGGQWFPKVGVLTNEGWECEPYYAFGEFFSDFGAYEVTLETPTGALVAASGGTGKRIEDTADGFEVRQFQVSPVHDFGFAVAKNFAEKTILVGHVSVRIIYPIDEAQSAMSHLEAVERGLPFFEDWLGEYPYPWLTIVQVPEKARGAGGMEYPTLITTWKDTEIPFGQSNVGEETTLHELAHQWFYGVVASNEVAHPFLDEGLTTYVTSVAMDALYGSVISFGSPFLQASPEDVNRLQALVGKSFDPILQSADRFRDSRSYGSAVYGRTALALASLRELTPLGHLHRALGEYARSFRFKHPTPDDLYQVLAGSLKRDIKFFWDQALSDAGEFDYAMTSLKEEGGVVTALIERRGEKIAPARVVLHLEDQSLREALWAEGSQTSSARSWERFTFEGVEGLIWAEVVPLPSEYLRHGNALWPAEKKREMEWQAFFSVGSVFQFVGSLSVLAGW